MEQIFDAASGDLFVARVAPNVASPDLIASLEYATKYAGSKAILVLGHTKCGAVKGAWAGLEDGHLTGLLGRIQPAVAATKAEVGEEDSGSNLDRCSTVNVEKTIAPSAARAASCPASRPKAKSPSWAVSTTWPQVTSPGSTEPSIGKGQR